MLTFREWSQRNCIVFVFYDTQFIEKWYYIWTFNLFARFNGVPTLGQQQSRRAQLKLEERKRDKSQNENEPNNNVFRLKHLRFTTKFLFDIGQGVDGNLY